MSEADPRDPSREPDPTPPTDAAAGEAPADAGQPAITARPTAGSGLRIKAARGTIVNAIFLTSVNTLALVRGFLVAAFLTTAEYGVWGTVLVILATLQFLRQIGIGDKYIQQDEADQALAFRKAMTFELGLAGIGLVAGLALVPALAAIFGTPKIILPALASLLVIPAYALQAPLWIFYREMDFVRQRRLQAVDPVLGFVIAVALLIAGGGYWALIVGIVIGAWAGAWVSLRACPYELGLAFDRETLRTYASFSWPLVLAGGAAVVVGQGLLVVGQAKLGLAGVGIIALASVISQYSDRADQAITQTIYPTICAVKDRADLLFEAFVKSNRLALMWGAPFGFGLALFAQDLVQFAIGERWRPGVGLMQAIGVAVAIHQVGFNWDAFYRALGRTKPVGVAAAIAIVAFLAIGLPLLATDGLHGLALATLLVEAVNFAVRMAYLRRLFPDFRLIWHTARALLPSVPAAAVVIGIRLTLGAESSLLAALAMVALYVLVTMAATALLERKLLGEIVAYLKRRPGVGAAVG
ncbi:MAG TPA: oligosaccharide flippase family protein [Solirubrobacteraceae bacterium]|jgi:O-antigen/teichoic acid export membrane protein|nr:oligosaccharide flippase family protein [Solirubrobacteraceae bacterium]